MPRGTRWYGAQERHPEHPGGTGLEGTLGSPLGFTLCIRFLLKNFRNCFPKWNPSGETTESWGDLPQMLNSSHLRRKSGSNPDFRACCGKLGTEYLHPSCKNQLLLPKSILLDCQGWSPQKAAHLTNGENPAKAAPGTGWLPVNPYSARPVPVPRKEHTTAALGEGGPVDWDPFSRASSVAIAGTAACFIKSQLLAGKAVCLVGRGPTVLQAIPSQHFELKPGKNKVDF